MSKNLDKLRRHSIPIRLTSLYRICFCVGDLCRWSDAPSWWNLEGEALTSHKMSNRARAFLAGPLHYQHVCTPINEYGWTFYFLVLPKPILEINGNCAILAYWQSPLAVPFGQSALLLGFAQSPIAIDKLRLITPGQSTNTPTIIAPLPQLGGIAA